MKTGGCLCGAVRYEIQGELRDVVDCHCSKCRKFHGHYSAYTSVPVKDLKIVKSQNLKWYDSTKDETAHVSRGFCNKCESSLFWYPRSHEKISVAAGSLDEPTGLQTMAHIWISQMGDYYKIYDDHPQYKRGRRKTPHDY